MTPSPPTPAFPPTSDALVDHAQFVRSIACALLRDEHAAEDVVQETWIAALEQPPSRPGNLRGWLATVARRLASRRLRGERRRGRRERDAARPEALPVANEGVPREDSLRQVTDAVLALDEPYRSTVLRRYYEGLAPLAIARATDVPLATVKSRLQRGLAKLRRELDAVHGGDRRAWSLGLVTLLTPRDVAPGANLAGAGTMVSTMNASGKLLIGVASLAALGLGLRQLFDAPEGSAAGDTLVPLRATASAASPGESRPSSDAEASPGLGGADRTRLDVGTESSAAFGTLDFFATREATGGPAVDVPFRFVVWSAPIGGRDLLRRTDGTGHIRLEAVHPGAVDVHGTNYSFGHAEVVAGENARIDVVIAPGLRVTGTVVDREGRPVGGALLWLADTGNDRQGAVVARTDADGRFEILDAAELNRVGAVAPGHAPSLLHELGDYRTSDAQREIELELQLTGPGGRFVGRILHADGSPAAGAMVVMHGKAPIPIQLEPGRTIEGTPTRDVDTDAAGLFTIEGLPLGPAILIVRTLGTAPCDRTVQVQGAPSAPTVIHLTPEGVVEGVVRGADDAPAVRAEVRLEAYRRHYPQPSIRTDEEGRFRLCGLPTGHVALEATHRTFGRATTTVELSASAPGAWNPVLSRGRVVRGWVVDHEDLPLIGWHVTARGPEVPGGSWRGQCTTLADGGFEMIDCPPEVLSLELRAIPMPPSPPLLVEHLAKDADEIVLRVLPEHRLTSGVKGRILDSQGAPVRSPVALVPEGATGGSTFQSDDEGHFEIVGVPPGTYVLTFTPVGLPRFSLEGLELVPEEILDVGTTHLVSTGTLSIDIVDQAPGAPPAYQFFAIHAVPSDGTVAKYAATQFRSDQLGPPIPLLAGEYDLRVVGGGGWGYADEVRRFTMAAGVETRVELAPRPGCSCHVGIRVPEDAALPARVHMILRDEAGRIFRDFTYELLERELIIGTHLAPGPYGLDVSTPDGRAVSFSFTVILPDDPDDPDDKAEFVFPLR